MVVHSLPKAPRWGDEVQERIDHHGDHEPDDESEPRELHGVVGLPVDVCAAHDVARERGRDRYGKRHERTPVEPIVWESGLCSEKDAKAYSPVRIPVYTLLVSNIQVPHLDQAFSDNPEIRHQDAGDGTIERPEA